jgi:DNA ligase D-like protein (predicted ligase)
MKNSIFAGIPPESIKKAKKSPFPKFVPPMLATLTTDYFSRNDWIYEHKFDGERCLAFKNNGKVLLMSRNKRVINNEYPELVAALQKQKADTFVIDGEIIAMSEGLSDFELLQSRINLKDVSTIKAKTKAVPVSYAIFDLMYVHGYDIRELPLLSRKKILKKLLTYNKLLTYTQHKVGNGIAYFKQACKLHWEGLIAKKADSIYIGKRSTLWLKFKCIMKQELVIGGYTEPRKSRTDFGALLVGYYDKGTLKFAGKVGTGYTQDILRMLGKKLRALEIKKCPFSNYDERIIGVHWIKPMLVAEFQFAEWTKGNKLRVGRYKGLRDDKAAKDVVKEVPKAIAHLPK